MTKLETTLILILAGFLLSAGALWYAGHLGFERCVAGDEAKVEKQVAHNAQTEVAGRAADTKADTDYANAVQTPLAPLPPQPAPSVRQPPSCGAAPAAGPDRGAGPGPAPVRDEGQAGVVSAGGDPTERSDVQVGRDADAEVTRLQRKLKAMYDLCTG